MRSHSSNTPRSCVSSKTKLLGTAVCPSCHPTNSTEALNGSEGKYKLDRMRIDRPTHVPRSNEDGDAFDFRVETVHVLQLLDQLAEVLSLSYILKYVRLLLASRYPDV